MIIIIHDLPGRLQGLGKTTINTLKQTIWDISGMKGRPMTKTLNTHGRFTNRSAKRRDREHLLHRADSLPSSDRALLVAQLDTGMKPCDLAALKGVPVRTLRQKLRLIKDRLQEPSFLLAARFAAALEP